MAKNEVARGPQDVAGALAAAGPRDALMDPQPGDIIPDLETKGYHVGEVAQPAEPVLYGGGVVEFESLPEAPESKFEKNSFAAQKAELDAREVANPDLFGGVDFVEPLTDPEAVSKAKEALTKSQTTERRSTARESTASDLDADAAKVAKAQAREDKR